MECCFKLNVTHNGMSLKIECHLNQNGMSLKIEYYLKWNVTQKEM